MNVASDESILIAIQIDNFRYGYWKIEFELECNNESFHHQKEFVVKLNKILF